MWFLPVLTSGDCLYHKVGAFIIRIGFWGILYCNYKEAPQNSIGSY